MPGNDQSRSPLFTPGAARAFRRILAGAAAAPVLVVVGLMAWVRGPVATGQSAHVDQPIAFDHRIHAGALAIDCRYCHAEAERSSTAGLPPTEACVGCHQSAYLASSVFAPVRRSLKAGQPIPWVRVHQLPDFVYFDHSVHVQNGVDCAACHGNVAQMGVVRQVAPLTMQWCLDCHRAPESRVHTTAAVRHLVNCTACHR